jgi:hypothetical protein
MPEESKNKKAIITKEVTFKCKFCGQTKPLGELVLLRQYFPQLSSCKECAKGNSSPKQNQ